MPTRAPVANRVACGPLRSTTPTTWWPGTTCDLRGGNSPSSTCRSVRQTPQAWTRTSTLLPKGCGSATSVKWRGALSIGAGEDSRQAFIPLLSPVRIQSRRVHAVLTYKDVPRVPHTTAGQAWPEPSHYDTFLLDYGLM